VLIHIQIDTRRGVDTYSDLTRLSDCEECDDNNEPRSGTVDKIGKEMERYEHIILGDTIRPGEAKGQ
jgi:hypothetical protein